LPRRLKFFLLQFDESCGSQFIPREELIGDDSNESLSGPFANSELASILFNLPPNQVSVINLKIEG